MAMRVTPQTQITELMRQTGKHSAQIARLQDAFVRLMEALSVDADRPVGMIADHDPADDRLLARANNTRCDEPRRGIIEQFESQVRSSCDGIALVFGDEALSYGELNARANRLAWRLRDRGFRRS